MLVGISTDASDQDRLFLWNRREETECEFKSRRAAAGKYAWGWRAAESNSSVTTLLRYYNQVNL